MYLKANNGDRRRRAQFQDEQEPRQRRQPDEHRSANYGADAFRLYEMYMGPLEAQKPWNTRDIVGMSRFLNSVARKHHGR